MLEINHGGLGGKGRSFGSNLVQILTTALSVTAAVMRMAVAAAYIAMWLAVATSGVIFSRPLQRCSGGNSAAVGGRVLFFKF